ncbi:hypothetical protein DENSPDRAFT_83589 [Dentipellis sp. KUC8613]|nr:hypothetical protein DENSPDRAFT_83589 [Dentipellis sp. KUC8613]
MTPGNREAQKSGRGLEGDRDSAGREAGDLDRRHSTIAGECATSMADRGDIAQREFHALPGEHMRRMSACSGSTATAKAALAVLFESMSSRTTTGMHRAGTFETIYISELANRQNQGDEKLAGCRRHIHNI